MSKTKVGTTIEIKFSNFDRRGSWRTIPLNRIKKELKSKNASKFDSGDDAFYLHSRIYLDQKTFSYWICLDIEDKNNHESIPQNIKAAQNLLIFLQENDLTDSLTIMLTGSGFRFVWPWIIPIEFKKAFISWIKQEKDIDSSVQQGNKFIRMLGYRGNPRQGKLKDLHIHKLDIINELWSLDEKKYKELTQGKPVYSECMSWLDDGILPCHPTPQAWIDFLNGWKIYTDLQQTIWKPSFAPGYSIDHSESWKQIYTFLGEQGLSFSEQTRGDIWFLKLNSCPSCGRGDASPYVTSTGRLKCHHANTCDAGVMGDNGLIGLAPTKWIPGFNAVELVTKKNSHQMKNKLKVRADIKKGLQSAGDILMRVDPGVGKTYTTLENEVPKCNQMKILYAGPTHKLSREVFNDAKKFAGNNVPIYYLEGRNDNICKNYDRIIEVASRGLQPGIMVCSCCDEKKNNTCHYFNQFKPLERSINGFFVTTHAQLGILDLDCHCFDTLIVDEDPLQSFFETSTVEMSEVFEFAEEFEGNFFNKIEEACDFVYISAESKDRTFGSHNRLYVDSAPKNSPWENSNNL